ncbi:DUF1223 domain-containing protein [Brevundimonas variabilis]|uniref:DUF1223 domain-containing protein n=1 Tax=Brevundimonas variabilis TaxID=74312 RepID=A0A7W9FCQ9_9CAUL|nr:DUF1223 domain-containing protein [Brevundimonas variabilis]MBB5744447.1 hypothetical protein [Brevundimonas variabilis]
MIRLIVLLSALAVAIGVSASIRLPPATPAPAAARSDLTVVELFTSQGCSSCPPANANLGILAQRQDILALSWGVTYWDQLGWKDTFASDAYTRRQRDYQRGLGTDNVWTPQVVVDGRRHVVGQRMAQIEALIARHDPFTGPQIVIRNGGVGLAGGRAPVAPADVWLVRYEPRPIEVPVARGENGGSTLPHANVVRELVRLGDWSGTTRGFRLPAAARPDLKTAVLIQAPNGGPILNAARG